MTTCVRQYETLELSFDKGVLHVRLNRPKSLNAMNPKFWEDVRECFHEVAKDTDVRCVVLSGNGKCFTAGLDLKSNSLSTNVADDKKDGARVAFANYRHISAWQESFSAIEKCPQPVIAAIHGACVGGGIDMATACDVRYCSSDAWFTIKEVDVGLAADVGTFPRLPKVCGNESLLRELAYTGRRFDSAEAKELGLISRVLPDRDQLMSSAVALATTIASKSPVAVAGTKHFINFSRDHTVAESLDHIAIWNSAMLQTKDIATAVISSMQRKTPKFAKL